MADQLKPFSESHAFINLEMQAKQNIHDILYFNSMKPGLSNNKHILLQVNNLFIISGNIPNDKIL